MDHELSAISEEKESNKVASLRLRISAAEVEALQRLLEGPFKGCTMSDVVRSALALLFDKSNDSADPASERKLAALATFLKRSPDTVREACVNGICDLIQNKTASPLIVMETKLYLNYGHPKDEPLPWHNV
jgi:outer membrane protein OmpA-like peptidoglycan-associated protein